MVQLPEDVFHAMQAENWSPNGEARKLIQSLDVGHTSMCGGDIIYFPSTDRFIRVCLLDGK